MQPIKKLDLITQQRMAAEHIDPHTHTYTVVHTCYQLFIYIHWSVRQTLNKLGNTHAHKETIDRKTTLILHYPPSIHLTHRYTRSPGCMTSDPPTHTALIKPARRHTLFIFSFLFIFCFYVTHCSLSLSFLSAPAVFHLEKIFSDSLNTECLTLAVLQTGH